MCTFTFIQVVLINDVGSHTKISCIFETKKESLLCHCHNLESLTKQFFCEKPGIAPKCSHSHL